MFRKKCFENVGGYLPNKGGGIDWIAVTTARMKGWKTRTFLGKSFFHHRTMGTGNSNLLGSWFRLLNLSLILLDYLLKSPSCLL